MQKRSNWVVQKVDCVEWACVREAFQTITHIPPPSCSLQWYSWGTPVPPAFPLISGVYLPLSLSAVGCCCFSSSSFFCLSLISSCSLILRADFELFIQASYASCIEGKVHFWVLNNNILGGVHQTFEIFSVWILLSKWRSRAFWQCRALYWRLQRHRKKKSRTGKRNPGKPMGANQHSCVLRCFVL